MVESTEVDLTTRTFARVTVLIAVLAIIGILVGTAAAWPWISSGARVVWAGSAVGGMGFFVVVGYAVSTGVRPSEALRASGVEILADVLSAKVEDWHDDGNVYELRLRLQPVDGDEFTVTHRCWKNRCRDVAKIAPTTITALVDGPTRTWAVIH